MLVGTGHVFRIADAVRGAIEAIRPDAVFVELDRARLQALVARQRGGGGEGRGGSFLHRRLQRFQEQVAGMYGAEAGSEMLAAVEGARRVGARVHLVDQPAEETLRQAVRGLTLREWLRVAGMVVVGGARALMPGRRGRRGVEQEIRRYEEDPAAAMAELRRRFPSLYRVVIEERDAGMVGRVRAALPQVRCGVVVVGDGHVDGMQRLLGDVPLQVHRLSDVRAGRLPEPPSSNASMGFTVIVGPPVPDEAAEGAGGRGFSRAS